MGEVVDPAAGSLLRSKLTPPQASVEYLIRPQLEAALAANAHARVVLLAAPAGFGKTSALVALAKARALAGCAVAWLSLGSGDDEPSRFLLQLIETLARLLPGVGVEAQAYLQNTMRVPVAAVMESLLVDLAQLETPLLLVLDDLHLIQDGELIAALNRLIKFAPAGFTLAIGSRSQPALSLATLRAKGLLVEIGEQELRLSKTETRDYLARSGLQLDAVAFSTLYNQTEGWMVGVHLASLWLRHQPQAGAQIADMGTDQAAVGAYLLRSVFEQLPADKQELLLALGVAQQLSGDLANALTGRQGGQLLLEELEAMQLFLLPLDRERQWYRFHNLFAEFLRARLKERDPERFKQLHFNASLWFTNHHMQNLAIEHACLAEDPEMLAALVDGCGLELINRGQLHRIYKWRQHVPDEIAERFPVLVLADIWTRAAELGLNEANRMLDEQLERWGEAKSSGPLSDKLLATLAIKAVIALQKDDLQTCIALARRVEVQLGQHTAFLEVAMLIVGALANVMLAQPEPAKRLLALAQQRNHFLEGRYLDMQLANIEVLLCLEQGQIRQAELLFAQLRAKVIPWFAERSRALALPTITEALIAYHQGRLQGIEERLRWALATVDVINPVDLYAQGMLCMAHVQRMQDSPKEAYASLVLMQNLSARNQSWRFYAQAVADEVAQILQEPAADRLKRAEQRLKTVDWAKLAEPYQQMRFNPVLWVRGLTRIRLQQARGHYSEALHEITQLRGLLLDNWHGLQRLRLDLLAALSYQRLGYQERAQSLLVQCLIGAEREGVRSLFVEEGEAIRLLLQQLETAERQPALQGFIRGLLAIWPGQGARQSLEVPDEGLTEREREVICLAAQGLSNEQIGQRLALALGTVKWHLHNIYEKLKVRNRTQAIRRARELSLLEP
ncbi:LuxR C-terminal-related transcriptional regulator [Pseudomonas sp.]|uniref:LuxR C-terminal-related transcriptional regulator n=1 Tax=Pseudomonas sp. TaxID=306 RepID=UPI002736CEAF|nr:LuxR C-terminal-related transcriptional regulator [Pseudomonas sp.]MDP3814337.1 LuxR C-terminal-related transcriptional regulator [Pseudomonas sp.]